MEELSKGTCFLSTAGGLSAQSLTVRIMQEYFGRLPRDDYDDVFNYVRNYIVHCQETNRQTKEESSEDSDSEEISETSESDVDSVQDEDIKQVNEESDDDREFLRTDDGGQPITPYVTKVVDSIELYQQVRALYEHFIKSDGFVGHYQFYMDVFWY